MRDETGLWSVEEARSWLMGHEWGAEIVDTLEENAAPIRRLAWVRLVMDMHRALASNEVPSGQDSAPPQIQASSGPPPQDIAQ